MSLSSPFSRSQTSVKSIPVTSLSLLDFLVPSLHTPSAKSLIRSKALREHHGRTDRGACSSANVERHFFSALVQVGTCPSHPKSRAHCRRRAPTAGLANTFPTSRSFATSIRSVQQPTRSHANHTQRSEETAIDERPDPGGGIYGRTQDHGVLQRGFFDYRFQQSSHLPQDFFNDVGRLQEHVQRQDPEDDGWDTNPTWPIHIPQEERIHTSDTPDLSGQLKLLDTVRELEEKLAQAKKKLQTSFRSQASLKPKAKAQADFDRSLTLGREDYKGLVDLYYYTHKNRFTPEAPDYSPTPQFLDDYSFKLSEDFAGPDAYARYYEDEENYESPLKELEKILKSKRLREVSIMQKFVDLLLDDHSSTRALFEVYQKLPSPGVAFLPRGVIRVFLQRMSTPSIKSKNAMLRYLSLIDDMQKAELPISRSEWSSAIYLAGRSFGRVTESDMTHAFKIWRQMEQEAGVTSSSVTFNILFDIAVRAGKYVIADNILQEMHSRGLRLNRLGRVSLIYYHGLRGDGDAVRKTYRDFVDAGEIVDTLVLNCVIASLMNAGEPAAAEQTYERMKDLQTRFIHKKRADGSDLIYKRYPGAPGVHMNRELASNSLGRVLWRAPHLRTVLPEHHTTLQDSMPLRPDHATFRAMIAYHANVSGDLNRLTVLLNEMVETFDISMRSVHFQLLFKGFALHGKQNDPDATWSIKKLDLAWDACRKAVKDARKDGGSRKTHPGALSLPTAKAATTQENATSPAQNPESPQPPRRKRLGAWSQLALELAAFPDDRNAPIKRVHAELFDEPDSSTKDFSNPFFTSASDSNLPQLSYRLGDSTLDHEEGEYVLPGPTESIHANHSSANEYSLHYSETPNHHDSQDPEDEEHPRRPEDIHLTRPLVCWLLRAYARCTGSRERVERVWNSVRLLWKAEDQEEMESAMRVLRRCVRGCDANGGYML